MKDKPIVNVVVCVKGGMVQGAYTNASDVYVDLDVIDLDVSSYPDDGETDEVVILKMEQDENEEYILVPEEDLEILDRAYELFKDRNLDLFEFED